MDLKEIIKQVTPPFITSSYKKARHKDLLSSKELLYEYCQTKWENSYKYSYRVD